MSGEFSGLAAVITGGASGIGAATAALLAERGASVACLDLTSELVPAGTSGVYCDVADTDSAASGIARAVELLGRLDIVVNNAGIGAQGDVTANPDEEWLRVLNVNLLGIVRVSRAALPHLTASPAAAIVNTCSVAASTGLPRRALYTATKGAVQALTLAMAADHLVDGIRVNCVNPGTADTPWIDRLLAAADDPAAERAALRARQPTGNLVAADEVARAIAYLASPLSPSTTGTVLAVDGGLHSLRLPQAAQA